MFWKFGFQSASSIDTLLDREDVDLEHILDEDDLLQECKSQNTRLISYFQRIDVLKRLLGYVSGEIEGEERGRFKYPYVATEVLCSEIWSIVETCSARSSHLLAPWWDYVLDIPPEELKNKATIASHFAKINAVFLTKKPDEIFHFIQSQPAIVERLLRHIETPSFTDLIFRMLQLDEHPGNMGVVEWFAGEGLIPRLITMLSPAFSPDRHAVVAEFIKGIIALSAPSPASFPLNPSSVTMMIGDEITPLPISNRLARELGQEQNITKLMGFMLDEVPLDKLDSSASQTYTMEDDTALPSTASVTSSLMNSIAIFIELIRKNNSDYYEPYLFHTIRRRLIQIQQQNAYSRQVNTEDDERDELERLMEEVVDHLGVVHLGSLLDVVGKRLGDFQQLLAKPRSSTRPIITTAGSLVPLTFERFRICELYAELLHCSNMALLNRPPGTGPVYDGQGRLVGGLMALEALAKVFSLGSTPSDSPNTGERFLPEDEDPAASLSEAMEHPTSGSLPNSADISSVASEDPASEETGSDDVSADSDLVDGLLEELKMEEDPRPKPNTQAGASSAQPTGENPKDAPDSDGASSGSEKTLKDSSPFTNAIGRHLPTDGSQICGDALKAKFLELGIVTTLLDLFFEFPLNNFLHNVVYDFLHQIITGRVDKGYNRELVISLFRDSRILHRIVEGQRKNDEACLKPRGLRLGYMGHLTLISEDIVTAFEHYPPDLVEILASYSPLSEWEEYVTGKYKETKDKDTSQLGGGRPTLGLGVGIIAGFGQGVITKTTEESDFEIRRDSTSSTSGGSSGSSTAAANDEERSGGQFERYLVQQIQSQDQFSSSTSTDSDDDDDDDAGWLEAGHRDFQDAESGGDFALRAPPAVSRQQFAATFEEQFDPGTNSVAFEPPRNDSDEDDAWGPFSDSAAPRDASGSFSSSFTLSEVSDDGFGDSFGDEFGDFQSGDTSNPTPVATEEGDGGRTPTPVASSFGFESDFETAIFGTPSSISAALEPDETSDMSDVKDDRNDQTDGGSGSGIAIQQQRVPLPPPSPSP